MWVGRVIEVHSLLNCVEELMATYDNLKIGDAAQLFPGNCLVQSSADL